VTTLPHLTVSLLVDFFLTIFGNFHWHTNLARGYGKQKEDIWFGKPKKAAKLTFVHRSIGYLFYSWLDNEQV
jgi:hypothetical protein